MLAALATRLGVVRKVGTVLDVTSAVLLPFTAAQSLVAWGGHTLRVRPTFGGQSRGFRFGSRARARGVPKRPQRPERRVRTSADRPIKGHCPQTGRRDTAF